MAIKRTKAAGRKVKRIREALIRRQPKRAPLAPPARRAAKPATQKRTVNRAAAAAVVSTKKPVASAKAPVPEKRPTKRDSMIDLLKRPEGVTAALLQEISGWQAHSLRGFISGTLNKKCGLDVKSFLTATNERAYIIGTLPPGAKTSRAAV